MRAAFVAPYSGTMTPYRLFCSNGVTDAYFEGRFNRNQKKNIKKKWATFADECLNSNEWV